MNCSPSRFLRTLGSAASRVGRQRAALSLSILLVGLHSVAWSEETAIRRRFIYNCDGDNLFIYHQPPMSPADLHQRVDEVADTGVTTFFMCPNIVMVMNYPSAQARMLGDERDPETLARIKSEGAGNVGLCRAALNLQSLVDQGDDPLGLVIDRAKNRGMETFITFRLNEVHSVDEPDLFSSQIILSSFWKDHPNWRVGKLGDPANKLQLEILGPGTHPRVASWLPEGLDFAVPEVRAYRLAELRECCERYDIDGLDLDFQRFPVYFKSGEEAKNIQTMTSWMREVRAMTREIGAKRGRPILLSARIMARPDENQGLGLDPFTWANEGLIDFVILSHYLQNNFPLPIQEYRQRLPAGMPIYASIEVEREDDTYRKIADQLWKDGADGIQMFNFASCRESGREPSFGLLKELAAH